MDKTLVFFGIFLIILGVLVAYYVLTSVIAFGQIIKTRSSSIPGVKMNEIYLYGFIDIIIVLIGILVIREGFKR